LLCLENQNGRSNLSDRFALERFLRSAKAGGVPADRRQA
jgi:hypothetical protein